MSKKLLAKPLVTIDDFVDTYSKETYHCERARVFLKKQGNLPLTYTSPHFTDINILAAWLFWSGSISNYDGNISAEPEYHQGIRDAADNIDLGIKLYEENDLSFAHNGAAYSRLLTKLGIPNGEGTRKKRDIKPTNKLTLPSYLTHLMKPYGHFFDRSEGEVATKTLADQCRVLLWSRSIWNSGTHCTLSLIENRDKRVAERLGKQVLDMFNVIYPKIGLDGNSMRTTKSRQNYRTKIVFSKENLFNAIRFYGLFDIKPNFSYHKRGRTTLYKK